ncbi:hypothetical protein D8810_10055 [Streptococcus gordonii]|uniref:DUF1642 domain-containing protein n=1 Tax=Streptococcus gordonii TaxID=1302 RepID=UPI000F669EB0|nr:DUF1642 domain-containing protein [Streptococcus gordonii]RSJ60193.1 hypothetical protein D8810_10055 [Streptococcus gordonii]
MNKQELIEYCESLKGGLNKFINGIDVDKIIAKIKQLDEPEKPVIPQFVADWIEYCKFTHVDLQHALIVGDVYFYNYANQKDFSKLKEFLDTENNQETFTRAWLDGYTVEEEAKYKVEFKGISGNINCLNHNSKIQKWYLASNYETDIVRTKFTRKELEEAGFGEVFNSPLFEVEEVQE